MRLVTFEDPVQRARIGAMTEDGRFVDLHSACALYLREIENESAFERLADALVPPNMLALFEGGDTSLEAAHQAFDPRRPPPPPPPQCVFFFGGWPPQPRTRPQSLRPRTEERRRNRAPRRDHLLLCGRSQTQGSDRSAQVLSHRWQLPRAPRRSNQGRLLPSRDAVDRLLPERRRHHRPRRARNLSRAPHAGTGLRIGTRRSFEKRWQAFFSGRGCGTHWRLCNLQRHHCPRHSAPRDEVRRVQLLQGYRHLLPSWPVDRHRRRDSQSAQSRHGAARQRTIAAALSFQQNVSQDSRDSLTLFADGLQRR